MMKSKTELEADISQAMIRLEKEFMGRGPLETRTYLLDDIVLVRLRGVLTVSEIKLVQEANERGASLLKQVRQELLNRCRPLLEAAIKDILGVPVKSMHTDISTKTGSRVIVFALEDRLRLRASVNGDRLRQRLTMDDRYPG